MPMLTIELLLLKLYTGSRCLLILPLSVSFVALLGSMGFNKHRILKMIHLVQLLVS